MTARLIGIFSFLGIVFVTTLSADVITLTPDRDNSLFEDPINILSGGQSRRLIIGRTNTQDLRRRSLIHFDLSAIPPGSTVVSARLTLRLTQVRIPFDTIQASLHRLLKDWGEGASDPGNEFGKGAPAELGDATWEHNFFDDQFWDNEGGDFLNSATATLTIEGQNFYTWESPQLGADVQSWLDQPADNFGWLLRGGENQNGTGRAFESRESTSASGRPQLEIEFNAPAAPGEFAFAAAALDLSESDGVVPVTVLRRAGSLGAATVEFSADDGSAVAGGDFAAVAGVLNFADGQESATFNLTILNDEVVEPPKTFTLSLSNPTGGTSLGSPSQITATITDDDFFDLFFAQFGNGAGLIFSQITLVNPDLQNAANVTLQLRDDAGQPLDLLLSGQNTAGGMLQLQIPSRGTRVLQSDGAGDVVVGSATVRSDQPLSGVILFGGATGLAGVNASQAFESGFFAPVEISTQRNVNTGIAVMNLEDQLLSVSVELIDEEGMTVASGRFDLAALGHLARFADELFNSPQQPVDFSDFRGTVRVTASGRIAATALQTRPNQLATLPATAN